MADLILRISSASAGNTKEGANGLLDEIFACCPKLKDAAKIVQASANARFLIYASFSASQKILLQFRLFSTAAIITDSVTADTFHQRFHSPELASFELNSETGAGCLSALVDILAGPNLRISKPCQWLSASGGVEGFLRRVYPPAVTLEYTRPRSKTPRPPSIRNAERSGRRSCP